MKKYQMVCGIVLFFLLGTTTYPQQVETLESVLFDDASIALINGIHDMNIRKVAVAKNVANATTPGYRPIRFQDEIDDAIRLYGDPEMLDTVSIDDELVKGTRIRILHSAYVKLLTTKMGITKRVVTLGKGG